MKILKEKTEYTVVLLGGSIGSKPIRSVRELRGIEVIDPNGISSKEKAKENAKKMNGYLSPGEKKILRLEICCGRSRKWKIYRKIGINYKWQ